MKMRKMLALMLAVVFLARIGATACALETELSGSDVAKQTVSSLVAIDARLDFTFMKDTFSEGKGERSAIASPYYLSAFPVTNEQYAAFVAETAHRTPGYWKNGSFPVGKGSHPVLGISYSDAFSYCEWLSSKAAGWSFRLPTEAEWENAARGQAYDNTTLKYPDGSEEPRYDAANGRLDSSFNYNGVTAAALLKDLGADYPVRYVSGSYARGTDTLGNCIALNDSGAVSNWSSHGRDAEKGSFLETDLYAAISADGGRTTPVDAYPANSLGLYDMAGNSWDLTSTTIVANNGAERGVSCYAIRGGSWYATSRSCMVSYRGEGRKDIPSPTVGFRVAADYSGASVSRNPFTDVPNEAYYAKAVNWAVEKGITAGTSKTTFSPNQPCTRAQAVTFLWNAAGKPAVSGSHTFTDVKVGSYYEKAVIWAVQNGITSGTSATTFGPNDTCTRGQIVTFLYNAAGKPAVSGSHPFTDVKAGAYYEKPVIWAVNHVQQITSGTSTTTFSPCNDCTRSQIVTFLYRTQ